MLGTRRFRLFHRDRWTVYLAIWIRGLANHLRELLS